MNIEEEMEKMNLEKPAMDIWESFKKEIIYHNRFRPEHRLIKLLEEYITGNQMILSKDSILYRGRIIDYGSQDLTDTTGFMKRIHGQDCGVFEGYDEKGSFVPPPDMVGPGRANPEKIVYLYTAKEIVTAIAETRPRITDHVSVAKIKLLQDVRLVDFTAQHDTAFTSDLVKILTTAFSAVCKNPIDYVPTQFISEYAKVLGLDGIVFRSSFIPAGVNVTIFHPEMAKAVASAPYRLNEVVYYAERLEPFQRPEDFELTVTNKKSAALSG